MLYSEHDVGINNPYKTPVELNYCINLISRVVRLIFSSKALHSMPTLNRFLFFEIELSTVDK